MPPTTARSLCDAVARAVRETAPASGLLDQERVADDLEKRISAYWGPDHGISRTELLATARDAMTASHSLTGDRQPGASG